MENNKHAMVAVNIQCKICVQTLCVWVHEKLLWEYTLEIKFCQCLEFLHEITGHEMNTLIIFILLEFKYELLVHKILKLFKYHITFGKGVESQKSFESSIIQINIDFNDAVQQMLINIP